MFGNDSIFEKLAKGRHGSLTRFCRVIRYASGPTCHVFASLHRLRVSLLANCPHPANDVPGLPALARIFPPESRYPGRFATSQGLRGGGDPFPYQGHLPLISIAISYTDSGACVWIAKQRHVKFVNSPLTNQTFSTTDNRTVRIHIDHELDLG
jgi:hypothetical protein